MIINWSRLLLMGIAIAVAESLSTGMLEDVATADEAMKPKAKRAQEVLMFGNQQSRHIDNAAANNLQPSAEKRTLRTSGLEDVKAALVDDETFSHQKQSNAPTFNRDDSSPYDKNFLYGKVMVSEGNENIPRNNWELPPPYSRYYEPADDRRKRSDKIGYNSPSSSTTISSPTVSSPPSTSGSQMSSIKNTPRPLIEAKRSPPVYPELRYKRTPDREDLLALLSLWENSPRNRNWRNYANDEYDNVEDDSRMANTDMMSLDDEESRNSGGWLDSPMYNPHHYNFAPDISSSEMGIPRTHPINSYEQQQYSSQYSPPYESTQYGTAQYGSLYPHHYYPYEKRFMVSRKRSQGYDSYNDRNINDVINFSQMMNSQLQGYPNYPQRMMY